MFGSYDFSNLSDNEFLSAFQYAAVGVCWIKERESLSHFDKIKVHPSYSNTLEALLSKTVGRGQPIYANLMIPMLEELAKRLKTNREIFLPFATLLKGIAMEPEAIASAARNFEITAANGANTPKANPLDELF
jgi:hypothetical protein